MNPIAQIPWATSTAQKNLAQCWWSGESVLWGSLHFRTLKVLTLCQSAKVKQRYLSYIYITNIIHNITFRIPPVWPLLYKVQSGDWRLLRLVAFCFVDWKHLGNFVERRRKKFILSPFFSYFSPLFILMRREVMAQI